MQLNQFKKRLSILSLFHLCFLFSMSLHAVETSNVPDFIPGSIRVSAEELINVVENVSGAVLIDARMDDDGEGVIEGSVNLPDVNTNCTSLAKILASRSTPVIFYCNGVSCGRSVRSVKIALSCGYSSIYWYRGGFKDWKDKGYPFISD